MTTNDLSFLDMTHFTKCMPVRYEDAWISSGDSKTDLIYDDCFHEDETEESWSSEIEEIHEEPTKDGWIEVYERNCVLQLLGEILSGGGQAGNQRIVEFGASVGYMIEEIKSSYPSNEYIATDLLPDGLYKSYQRNPGIMHIRCDSTQAPFVSESMDVVYALNILEHITDDCAAIGECYRILKKGGYCLFVVPRGEKLYDYYDEMLFHKRRYASKELREKAIDAGFQVVKDFHFAWLCYPAFFLKKKWNRFVSKRLTREEKINRVKSDMNNAYGSRLAILAMKVEGVLSKVIRPPFGIRELILLRK